MEATPRKVGTDATEFKGGFQKGLPEVLPAIVKIVKLVALGIPEGIKTSAQVFKFGRINRAHPDGTAVDELLLVENPETVALLDAEKVNGPGVDLTHFDGQGGVQVVVGHSVPETRSDGSAGRPLLHAHFLTAQGNRPAAVEAENHIFDAVVFIHKMQGLAGGVAILKKGIGLTGSYFSHIENSFGVTGQLVHNLHAHPKT